MRVHVLCEDALTPPLRCEHGLSLYIQTNSHHVLLDAGQSDVFVQNASDLNVDLTAIDTVVLSHGHYDHGNGLLSFLQINDKARIFVHQKAFGDYFHAERYIGLDKKLLDFRERFCFVSDDLALDQELTILTADAAAGAQTSLVEKIDGTAYPDHFAHELYLEVTDASKKAIFTGCAHKGVISIAQTAARRGATHMVGGFHLTDAVEDAVLKSVACALAKLPLVYYTGHCTSAKAFAYLKTSLDARVKHLAETVSFAIGDRAEIARFLFRKGFNCSQAVFGAFADELGLDQELAMRIASSFGGGMGRMREVCGAVSGMLMVCGCKKGYSTPETGHIKAEHYKQVQALAAEFRERHGSIICRELLGGTASDAPTPAARTEEFYRLRPCERLIASAAELAEKLFL